jgi:hypothetical protein
MIAALAVLAAAALVVLMRVPSETPPVLEPVESEPAAPDDGRLQLAAVDTPATPGDALAAAKVRELEAMSETFRNTTFLIAIRDSGYVCNDLLRVYGGLNDSAAWTATCSEMLAYTVRVASAGALRVEPMLEHVDGVPWPVTRGDDSPMPALPPRTLPVDPR